jgi:hypothetical protein
MSDSIRLSCLWLVSSSGRSSCIDGSGEKKQRRGEKMTHAHSYLKAY